jgi:phage shock protein C
MHDDTMLAPTAPESAPPPSGSGHTDTAGPGPQEQPRPLRRPTDDRVLFGVASGLGRYLGVDPVVVRVAFVLLAVFGGSGVLLYLLGLVAIPEERAGETVLPPARGAGGQTAAAVIGAVMVLVGSISLLGRLVPGLGDLIGPVLLVAVGVSVILLGGRR